ncbi:MAG: nicotinate-nicotinamide nucleotide adenylyltransferase [Syntrophobacterales bacterium]|nr:MAG: nicotinate-nicotinamide nucleotide adenylyltransferase [Syntrophobacterales bacterium]
MIEHIHDFQLLSRYHATIEEIRGDPNPRIILVSRFKGMAERQEKEVGVLPSSFNPITQGHMAILQGAAEIRTLREIILVLDTQAMDKEIFGATLVDRLLMLRVLFEDHPRFSVGMSNRGLFLAKAEVLKKMYPEGTDITFIVGYDTLSRLFDPKYYEDREGALDRLFACCTFMVTNRGNHGRKAVQRLMAAAENRRFKDKVHFFEIPNHLAQISSARVRQRVREEKAFARLVPSQVGEFIEEAKLYKADREVGPQGQRINLYDLRTQVLCQLYALYPEGRSGIDVGERVDKVVAGMRGGQRLETLLDSLPDHILGGRGKWFDNA